MYPDPELPGLQAAALMTFAAVANAFEETGDGFSGFRIGRFRMEVAKVEAEGNGFEWDGDLQREIWRVAGWYHNEIKRRRDKKKNG